MSARRCRTLIVDDHPLWLAALSHLIASDAGFCVVGEAADGSAALDLVRRERPDLLVLDLSLPVLNGLEVARCLQAERASVRVVMLTMHKEEELFNKALDFNVMGYVLKENAVSELTTCLRTVASGDLYLTPAMSGLLLRRHRRSTALGEEVPGLSRITEAERRVLWLIGQNRTSREIAQTLSISPRTVEAHRYNISLKLGLQGSHRLLHFAIENRSALSDACSQQ